MKFQVSATKAEALIAGIPYEDMKAILEESGMLEDFITRHAFDLDVEQIEALSNRGLVNFDGYQTDAGRGPYGPIPSRASKETADE